MDRGQVTTFEDFYHYIEKFHKLQDIPFVIFYTDPIHGDLLPINNDDNFARAVNATRPYLRLIIQKKGKTCIVNPILEYLCIVYFILSHFIF